MNHTSRIALQRAKHNIEKWFPLVGVLEELNKTTYLMEKLFPQKELFKGFHEFAASGRMGEWSSLYDSEQLTF